MSVLDRTSTVITCSACGLEARYSLNPDGLYAVEFDASQFAAKCKKPNPTKSFDCLELNFAMILSGRRTQHGTT